MREGNKESSLWEHDQGEHTGEVQSFDMRAVGFTSAPLVRHCLEVRLIIDNVKQNLMNRKGGWGQNQPPRLTIEDDRGETEGGKRKVQHQGSQSAKRQRVLPEKCGSQHGGQGDQDDPPPLHKVQ